MTTEDKPEAPSAVIRLRRAKAGQGETVLAGLCDERDLKTTAAMAKYIGVSDKTVSRIVDHAGEASGRFIAKVLARWPMCSFRSLFAVVDETTGEELR
jgi:hypothetical protein